MKPRFNSLHTATLAGSVVLSLGLFQSATAVQYWTGSGTWGTGTNWSNTSAGSYSVAWTNGTSDTATFEGTGGLVTLGVARNAKILNFNVTGYEIKAASALAITGTAAITVQLASGVTAKIGDNVTFQSSSTGQGWTLTSTSKTSILNVTGTIKNATANNNNITGITVNVNSGGLLQSANSLLIGGTAVGADLNLAGGKLDMSNSSGDSNLILNNTASITSSSTLTIGSGGEISFAKATNGGGIRFGGGSTAAATQLTGIINLDGGLVSTNKIYMGGSYTGGAVYNATVNFNGGTLRATQNQTAFLELSTTGGVGANAQAIVKSGGAIIDSNTFDIKIDQALLHDSTLGATADGGLTKKSAGTLTLSNTNTYTGDTTIKAGTLALSSTSTIDNSAKIIVGDAGSSGTVLDVTAKTAFAIGSGQTLKGIGNINIGAGKTVTVNGTLAAGNSIGTNSVTGNLTLAGTTQIELGTTGASQAAPGTSDRTDVSGALVLGGGLTVIDNAGANSNGSIGAGSYKIFSQAGTATGSFSSITNVAGYHAKVDTATSGSVFLDNYALATTGTIAAVDLGKARVGGSFSGSGALSVSNSTAANNGFTEGLNATQGAVSGDVIAGGSNVSNLAGASSSTSLTAGFSTATSGAKSGTTTINLASSGTNSGYADTSLGSQNVGVTGSVYDYATALFSQTGGDGSLTGGGTSYTLDFGSGLLLNTNYTATLQLANGTFFNAFQDNLGGSYTPGGASEFSTTAAAFSGLVSNGNNSFTITFNTGSTGTFNGTLDFAGLSQQSGLADANLANINIAFTGTAVPEPNVAALLGGLGTLALLRRRRA